MRPISFSCLLLLVHFLLHAAVFAQSGDRPREPFLERGGGHVGTTATLRRTTRTVPIEFRRDRPKATPENPIPDWVYTSRPLKAVGTIRELNETSSTVLLDLEQENCKLPNSLEGMAREAEATTAVRRREFPLQRQYLLTTRTMTMDGRMDPRNAKQTPATSGQIERDRQRLPRDQFKAGDRVSILYRMSRGEEGLPRAINMSKLAPGQEISDVDFNPLGRRVDRRLNRDGLHRTTDTRTSITRPAIPARPAQ